MKKVLLFICLVFFVVSCKQDLNKKVVLLGELKNIEGIDSVFLKSQSDLTAVNLASKIGDKGDFKFNLEIETAGYYYLQSGKNYFEIFLSPGDSLNLIADVTNIESSLTYAGIGADNNNFMLDLKKATPAMGPDEMFMLDEQAFTKFNDSLLDARNKMLTEAAGKNDKITKEFVENQNNVNLYKWANNNVLYKPYHAYYAQADDFKTSDQFNDYLKKVNLNDSTLLTIAPYAQFLASYFQVKAQDEAEKDTIKYNSSLAYLNLTLELYAKEITDLKILELLTFNTLFDEVRYSGTKNAKDKIEKFIAETKNQAYVAKINAEIAKWKNCQPGIQMTDYKFNDINGKEVAFSSFKGKFIYIDVWATWCGPCKGEIPSLKKLEEKYKKDKIVFVSVSVDEDKKAWEDMVKNDKLQGIQVWAVSWKNQLCQDFNINGIPRFILIDSKGLILDPDAERPSGKIDEKIAELLKTI